MALRWSIRSLCALLAQALLSCVLRGAERPWMRLTLDNAESLTAYNAVLDGEVTFVDGRLGGAGRIGKGSIRIPLPDVLPAMGTLEYWVRTEWPADGGKTDILYVSMSRETGQGKAKALFCATSSGASYGYQREMSVALDECTVPGRERFYQRHLFCHLGEAGSDDWYKVTVSYDLSTSPAGWAELYVDEVLEDRLSGLRLVPRDLGTELRLGSSANRQGFAVDDLRLYSVPVRYPQRPRRNLLDNPGFEFDTNADGQPDRWSQMTGKKGVGYWGGLPGIPDDARGQTTWERDLTHSGMRSARMSAFAAEVGGQIIQGDITGFVPGRAYQFDGAVRCLEADGLALRVMFVAKDSRGTPIQEHRRDFRILLPAAQAGLWRAIADVANGKNLYTPPTTCRCLNVYLLISGKGTVLWDDLYFGLAAADE